MSNRCPKGYSRYTKSKKNIYYNKCCKSGLEPSAEVCLTEHEENELIKKLNDEKIDKETLEKENKRVASELKEQKRSESEAAKALQKISESAAKEAAKASAKAEKKSESVVKEITVNNPLITKQEKELNNPLNTTEEREFIIRRHVLEKEEAAIKERALIRKKAAQKQKDYEPMHYFDKEERAENMKINQLKRELERDKNIYFASRREARAAAAAVEAVAASKYDAVIMPPPPPLLKRALSTNVADQMAGDCFAHSSTRVFLRMISREFFEKHKRDPSFVDLFHSIKENACDDLYLIKEPFSMFSEKHDIEKLCKNPGNYNSILMYFFLHKITIDKFDCQGGMPDYVLFYLLRIFNDLKNGRITLNQICNLGDPKYCEHLQPLITSFNQIETKYTAPFMHYTQDLMDNVKTPEQLIEHQNNFFDKIKEIIDLGLYVSLTINGLIPSMKTPTKTKPNARTSEFSQSEFLQLSNSFNKSTSTQLSLFSGNDHAVTIVDYDYSKPSNKQLIIKNSWGKPEHGNDIYIYISKKDLDLSPDQVSIQYLEPTNEYSLSDLAALNESISDKLPAYRANHLDEYDDDEYRDKFTNIYRKWYMVAIIFNSTNTINSFFEKYRIHSIDMTDIMINVLFMSTNRKIINKMISEDILRNVFDCIIVNLKRYPTTNKFKYRNWLRIINRNKQQDNIDYAELNEYFEHELKNLFSKTCSESVFGSCLPKSLRHFSRRDGPREGRGKTKKNRQKNREKKYNQSKKRRRKKKRNTKK
jgi:hypothetical protein